jgi:hypothetical protein
VLERAFIYWKNVDEEMGKRIEERVHSFVAVSSETGADVVIAEEGTGPRATA